MAYKKRKLPIRPSQRRVRGTTRNGATIPAPPARIELPNDYAPVLRAIKERIQQERVRVVLAANSSMILLYWDIGRMILERQQRAGWGAKIVDRLATDLSEAYPDMKGFTPRNLLFMRQFGEAYPKSEIVKQLVSQLPWGHVVRLLQQFKDADIRHWYMKACIEHGWSRRVLDLQTERRAHERLGQAVSNFKTSLPPSDSDLAAQAFKDPYVFDFLGTTDLHREREVEQVLVEHIQRFLLELGAGFAFVGRQVHLEIGDENFYIDLLFYHLKLRRYVVVELKAVPFDSTFIGQMNLYLSATDDLLRHPDDKPTIGLLLCRSKDKVVVEYALRDLMKPIGVAGWRTKNVNQLPNDLEDSLPTVKQIEAELDGTDGDSIEVKGHCRP